MFAIAPSTVLASSPSCDTESFDNWVDQHKAVAESASERKDHRLAVREYTLIAQNLDRCAAFVIAKRTQAGIHAGNTDPAALLQTHVNSNYRSVATYYSFAVEDSRALHDHNLTCRLILNEARALRHTDTALQEWADNFPSEVNTCGK